MRGLLVQMKKAHPGQDEAVKTCWQTLLKICGNVYNNPGGWRSWVGREREGGWVRSGWLWLCLSCQHTCLAAHTAGCANGRLPCLLPAALPACSPPCLQGRRSSGACG